MSGHSKWANIKRRKAVVDAQRGKTFSKLAREITVAARQGGPHPDSNFRLKTAIDKARAVNVPQDNIERAIARGAGAGDGEDLEELLYEGYGPGGVAILLEVMTDNRNRTAGEIRHLFSRRGGNLGEAGCVAWMFDPRAVVFVEGRPSDEDAVLEVALEAGADEVEAVEDGFWVYGAPTALTSIGDAFREAGYPVRSEELERVPKSRVEVASDAAEQLVELVEALEEHDDVQQVYENADFPDDFQN